MNHGRPLQKKIGQKKKLLNFSFQRHVPLRGQRGIHLGAHVGDRNSKYAEGAVTWHSSRPITRRTIMSVNTLIVLPWDKSVGILVSGRY